MPTKTLEATLVPPTAHKERKLQQLHDRYREGLHEAFDAGADTQSAVNDIVTPYDLPYQVKDPLENYVPSVSISLRMRLFRSSSVSRVTGVSA